jgi:hypothetical protein
VGVEGVTFGTVGKRGGFRTQFSQKAQPALFY